MGSQAPFSVIVLQRAGEPLDLREIGRRTVRMPHFPGPSVMWDDVYGVLKGAEKRGDVRMVSDGNGDFRDSIWVADPVRPGQIWRSEYVVD